MHRSVGRWRRRGISRACLGAGLTVALAVGAGLAPGAASAKPIALTKDNVPGLRAVGTSRTAVRTALTATMRGDPRGAVRSAPAATSAFRITGGRLLTGSIELRSDAAAQAVQRAAHSRTTLASKATASVKIVRAGRFVGLVSMRVKGRDSSVRGRVGAFAGSLLAQLQAADSTTVTDQLLHGTTKADALALFKLAYGTMPGAKIPAGERGTLMDGNAAVEQLLPFLDQLTPEQRSAFDLAVNGPRSSATGTRARRLLDPPDPPDPTLRRAPDYETVAEEFAAFYADPSHVGPYPKLPIRVYRSTAKLSVGAEMDSFAVNTNGDWDPVTPAYCRIRVRPELANDSPSRHLFEIAHEVFHCVDFSIAPTGFQRPDRKWVTEGLASWAATKASNRWPRGFLTGWFTQAKTPLFERAYDALGFFGRADEVAGPLWPHVRDILQSTNSKAAWLIAQGQEPSLRLTLASSLLRQPKAGAPWTTSQPFPLATSDAGTPYDVVDSQPAAPSVAAYGNHLVRISQVADKPIVTIERTSGNVRFTDGRNDYPDADLRIFCIASRCKCPPDQISNLPSPLPAVGQLVMALAGESTGGAAQIVRHPVSDYCTKKPKGKPGPGGSNGDPHLSSFDGLHFDFQAAGEFQLAKGSGLEIQARQEPWKIDDTAVKTATINTQLGFRIGGARVTIAAGKPLALEVNGTPTTIAPGANLQFGGATIEPVLSAYLLRWPDGSNASVTPVGPWGVAIEVELAAGRAGKVKGLLGNFDGHPGNDLTPRTGKRVAFSMTASAWPEFTRVSPVNPTSKRFADALYDRFGDSWRIRQSESLLDYAPGQTTKTFTDRSVPVRGIGVQDFPADQRAKAEQICRSAGVLAGAALSDCMLDVLVTGRSEFADAAGDAKPQPATTWAKLAAGSERTSPISLARTGDGTIHGVWRDGSRDDARLVHVGFPAGGGETPASVIAPYDAVPYAYASPEGVRVVSAQLDGGPPAIEGISQFSSGAPYDTWTQQPTITTPGAYTGEPMSLFADGTLLTTSGLAGNGRIYRGTGPGNAGAPLSGSETDGCYEEKPALASSAGQTVAAWYQWNCAQTGLYVAPVDPATGLPGASTLVPGTATNAWLTLGLGVLDRVPLAARPGGGQFVAFGVDDTQDTWSVRLWRVGDAAPLVAASGLTARPDSIHVVAEPTTGSLWVTWQSADPATGDLQLSVRKTDASGTAWAGAEQEVTWPTDAPKPLDRRAWEVVAHDGGLDVIAGAQRDGATPGGLWRASVDG